MLNMEEWVHIRHLHAQGLSIRAIARETGFSRNTIRTHLRDHSRQHLPELGHTFLVGCN